MQSRPYPKGGIILSQTSHNRGGEDIAQEGRLGVAWGGTKFAQWKHCTRYRRQENHEATPVACLQYQRLHWVQQGSAACLFWSCYIPKQILVWLSYCNPGNGHVALLRQQAHGNKSQGCIKTTATPIRYGTKSRYIMPWHNPRCSDKAHDPIGVVVVGDSVKAAADLCNTLKDSTKPRFLLGERWG